MKKSLACLLFALVAIATVSCKSDSSPAPASSFPTAPEAQAAEDLKSGGVYKGAIVGSSGSFAVVLQKGITVVNVTMDGVSKSLATTALTGWTSGQPIKNALFVSGDWEATFSVGANGTVPSLSLNIPGHPNAKAVLIKELSTAIVRVFEGTYTGSESGTWNFVVQGPVLSGVSRSADGLTTLEFFGLVDGTSITLDTITGSGTISGDNVSGTWQGTTGGSAGTWTGKRVI